MIFRDYIDDDKTVIGKYNIREPSPECPISIPNLILVPLLAFDTNKNRIGYGKGYYDNTLRSLKESW